MGKIIRMTLEEARKTRNERHNSPEFKAMEEHLRNIRDEDIDFSDAPEITDEAIAAGRFTPLRHGGARLGAGRKPLGNARITIQLPRGRVEQIRAVAKREKKTLSAVVNESLVLR